MTQQRNILMTIALPYANGQIHLGHLVEAIQGDIWHRFHRSCGHSCLFICGSDAHGTGIMISAAKEKKDPELWIEEIRQNHMQDYSKFLIAFDNFHSTHSAENKTFLHEIYQKLKNNGDISTKKITQLYDPVENIFLADRFIRGTCPRCKTPDQYGDNCEHCSATYTAADLIDPKSALSGATPIEKESEHYFFNLNHYQALLENWLNEGEHVPAHVANKLKEWFSENLRDWDISRDAPYFGFEIPDAPGKYFYVWLDAPIGYMASLKNLCDKNPTIKFDDYWRKDSNAELYHFIGKDIIYFHALFWPAMLEGSGYRLPTSIFVHGYLTINGKKMSKSRGTFITAAHYLEHFNPEYLRYYFAAKLNDQVEDIDFNFDDFSARVNSDLVGKYVNLASRCAGFITKKFDGVLSDTLHDAALVSEFVAAGAAIAEHFEKLDYHRAVRDIMALADRANQYIDHHKPWAMAKEEGKEKEVQLVCTQGINLFKILTTYLQPILPQTAENVAEFLNVEQLNWDSIHQPLLNHRINVFKPLMQRVTPEAIAAFTNHE